MTNQYAPLTKLLFTNLPFDCTAEYLRLWVEARGFRVLTVRLVRDIVSGTSPIFAYVQLMDGGKTAEGVRSMNGQIVGNRRIQVDRITALAA